MSRLSMARNSRVTARGRDGERMIMSGRERTWFMFNKTAMLWQSVDGSTPRDEIVKLRICTEFEVEPAEASEDAETLARKRTGHEMLQISPIPHRNPAAGESR